MKNKKKETTLNDLLNPINCIGEEVHELDTNLKISDGAGYVLISHPFIKNKLIFIRCYELFSLNGILVSLRSLIHEKKIVDEEIKSKLNDLILLIKLVDTYNGIDKKYNCTIKNKKLYIL